MFARQRRDRKRSYDRVGLHRTADAVKHEPRGLLGNAKCSVQLIRADAFLAVRYGPDCHKPRAILENGANLVRELPLWMLVFALPERRVKMKLTSLEPHVGQHMHSPAEFDDDRLQRRIRGREIADETG